MIKSTEENKDATAKKTEEVEAARKALYSKLETIGNLVHDTVPISDNEVCGLSALYNQEKYMHLS